MNLLEEVSKIMNDGYSEAHAEARLCQDIIIKAISQSNLSRNVTIKGGVVMRSLSNNARRATLDLDLDFIKYSISEDAIRFFIEKLNCIDGINLSLSAPIEEMKHRDYRGKRIHIEISDDIGYVLSLKMDIGVHKDLDIEQEEYCFDVCFQEDSVSVLINSREQMITEKLKSLIRFGTRSTRYKDLFDICYLCDLADMDKLRICINKYIYADATIDVNDADEIRRRVERIFTNSTYKKHVEHSKKNWLDLSVADVLKKNLEFIKKI